MTYAVACFGVTMPRFFGLRQQGTLRFNVIRFSLEERKTNDKKWCSTAVNTDDAGHRVSPIILNDI
jgi:hypothetical protein